MSKRFITAAALVAVVVAMAFPAQAAGRCVIDYHKVTGRTETCSGGCWRGETLEVEVSMKGWGYVEGTAICGDSVANCTAGAAIFPDDTCSDKETALPGTLKCKAAVYANFLGITPTSYTVTCTAS